MVVLIDDTAREARSEIYKKTRPLISEKLAFGCALFKTKPVEDLEF